MGSAFTVAALILATLAFAAAPTASASSDEATETAPDLAGSSAEARAARRSYDGAPPVPAHEDFGIDCLECHTDRGVEVEGVGLSPTMPHGRQGKSGGSFARCRQCHVFRTTEDVFMANAFEPLRQDLRRGERAHLGAPPVIPHRVFMRENCWACHVGERAREEIRTSHPERVRCLQCHVEANSGGVFEPSDPIE